MRASQKQRRTPFSNLGNPVVNEFVYVPEVPFTRGEVKIAEWTWGLQNAGLSAIDDHFGDREVK